MVPCVHSHFGSNAAPLLSGERGTCEPAAMGSYQAATSSHPTRPSFCIHCHHCVFRFSQVVIKRLFCCAPWSVEALHGQMPLRGPEMCTRLGTGLVTAVDGTFRLIKRAETAQAEAQVANV